MDLHAASLRLRGGRAKKTGGRFCAVETGPFEVDAREKKKKENGAVWLRPWTGSLEAPDPNEQRPEEKIRKRRGAELTSTGNSKGGDTVFLKCTACVCPEKKNRRKDSQQKKEDAPTPVLQGQTDLKRRGKGGGRRNRRKTVLFGKKQGEVPWVPGKKNAGGSCPGRPKRVRPPLAQGEPREKKKGKKKTKRRKNLLPNGRQKGDINRRLGRPGKSREKKEKRKFLPGRGRGPRIITRPEAKKRCREGGEKKKGKKV